MCFVGHWSTGNIDDHSSRPDDMSQTLAWQQRPVAWHCRRCHRRQAAAAAVAPSRPLLPPFSVLFVYCYCLPRRCHCRCHRLCFQHHHCHPPSNSHRHNSCSRRRRDHRCRTVAVVNNDAMPMFPPPPLPVSPSPDGRCFRC